VGHPAIVRSSSENALRRSALAAVPAGLLRRPGLPLELRDPRFIVADLGGRPERGVEQGGQQFVAVVFREPDGRALDAPALRQQVKPSERPGSLDDPVLHRSRARGAAGPAEARGRGLQVDGVDGVDDGPGIAPADVERESFPAERLDLGVGPVPAAFMSHAGQDGALLREGVWIGWMLLEVQPKSPDVILRAGEVGQDVAGVERHRLRAASNVRVTQPLGVALGVAEVVQGGVEEVRGGPVTVANMGICGRPVIVVLVVILVVKT